MIRAPAVKVGQAEMNFLIESMFEARENIGASEEEVALLVQWVQDVLIGTQMVDMALSRKIYLDVVDGRVIATLRDAGR